VIGRIRSDLRFPHQTLVITGRKHGNAVVTIELIFGAKMNANDGKHEIASNHAPFVEIGEFCPTQAKLATMARKALSRR
jgi:hypothetical protein